jgi:predicted nucleotidyltransferase
METEQKIIEVFLEEQEPKTIRALSKQIHSDYKITHTAAVRLIKKKILMSRKIGNSLLCELNPQYYGTEIYEAESARKEKLLKHKNINQLYKEIMRKLKSSLMIAILFGSYAKGKQSESSDIDLMFISNDKYLEEEVTSLLSLLPLKTHAFVFSEEEFISMKDSKKTNVVKEAINKCIILYGAENYHRLKNA